MTAKNKKIIADIGGTNARFALLNDDGFIQDEIVLKGAEHTSFVSAFQEYLSLVSYPDISEAAVAIANPIDGDVINMTNHDWNFSIEDARKTLGLKSLIFKNDFEALAMSIPFLNRADLHKVGGRNIKKKHTMGVIGSGTGLGVSGLIYSGEKWVAIPGEGGHVSLSPINKRQVEILEVCWQSYEHVSAERLISGRGLQIIYEAICKLAHVDVQANLLPKHISTKAINQTDPQCEEALAVFCSLLGVVAGNLALTLGAKGGIYIGGGIIPKLGGYFDRSPFREAFESKGRFQSYLKEIPVFVIKSQNPAFIGIKQVF